MTIFLHQLRFFAYHGMHPEEKLVGGMFEVNVDVEVATATIPVRSIHQTVNYTELYQMVRLAMDTPVPLLETFVSELAQRIIDEYPVVDVVNVAITKLNPPITQFTGAVGVSFQLKR